MDSWEFEESGRETCHGCGREFQYERVIAYNSTSKIALLLLWAVTLVTSALIPSAQAQYPMPDFNRSLCQFPYRSLDGGHTYVDLGPEFVFLTNRARGASAQRDPMPDWRVVAGRVLDVPRLSPPDLNPNPNHSGLLLVADKGLSSPGIAGGYGSVIHLLNFPGRANRPGEPPHLVDGAEVHCLAKLAGTMQYTTVQGATVTVLSYDFGLIPTGEQWAAFESLKRSNYLALVQGAALEKSNRLARQNLASQSWTNFSITPKRK